MMTQGGGRQRLPLNDQLYKTNDNQKTMKIDKSVLKIIIKIIIAIATALMGVLGSNDIANDNK
jgi:hypothetical protein